MEKKIVESIWADGIPAKIDPKDRMTEEDVLKLAINFALEHVIPKHYRLLGVNEDTHSYPNILVEYNLNQYAVAVVPSVFPFYRRMDVALACRFAADCRKKDFIPIFLGILVASNDPQRGEKSVLLKGDIFKMRLIGAKRITEAADQSFDVSKLDFTF